MGWVWSVAMVWARAEAGGRVVPACAGMTEGARFGWLGWVRSAAMVRDLGGPAECSGRMPKLEVARVPACAGMTGRGCQE